MPLYDFECPHGHRFERLCSMSERDQSVPCEGTVNQISIESSSTVEIGEGGVVPDGYILVDINGQPFVAKVVPCQLKASLVVSKHNNPGGALLHNSAANRDAAREGRYDPLNPSRKFISKGRTWRP